MAVASAAPYVSHLHLTPGRQLCQHLFTQFLQARCSSWRPTNSVKGLKAKCNAVSQTKTQQQRKRRHQVYKWQMWELNCQMSWGFGSGKGLRSLLGMWSGGGCALSTLKLFSLVRSSPSDDLIDWNSSLSVWTTVHPSIHKVFPISI